MKASDYIVEFLIKKNIMDVFGYPGGMVTHLMDSLGKYKNNIKTHITLHEQGAAFAACGYSESSGNVGMAFATSGPGATNLITGIGHAYFDSLPIIFITGQVNTHEAKANTGLRQKGFQETNIVSMVQEITKRAYYITDESYLPSILDEAYSIASTGRKGPVLIDIPMNIFKTDIKPEFYEYSKNNVQASDALAIDCAAFEKVLFAAIKSSKRPCILIGNGIKRTYLVSEIRSIMSRCPMPVVSSMLAVDVFPEMEELEGIYYGFIGAYGNRSANFVVAKSDLLICLGSRLDIRQTGGVRANFAPNARIIRVDIDPTEFANPVRGGEQDFRIELYDAIEILKRVLAQCDEHQYDNWLSVCRQLKGALKGLDEREPNRIINKISKKVCDGVGVVADVGQNMVWVAHSFKFKRNQRAYFSGSMGAMGYALPASIGIYYGTNKPVICFAGDGGFQMNIQELQYIAANKIPVKMFVINNKTLGMIRHFQQMYFEGRYHFTVNSEGYDTPDFVAIGKAYGIKSCLIQSVKGVDDIVVEDLTSNEPVLFEIQFDDNETVVFPKLEYGKPNQDQEPLIDRDLYKRLMEL